MAHVADDTGRTGECAVIFISRKSGRDTEGYARAADEMDALAATQPGYRGVDHVSDAEGNGVTISYWEDEAAAIAWRRHPEHRATREAGRGRWYDRYTLHVCEIGRSYAWSRDA